MYGFVLFQGNLRAHVVRLHSIPHNQETVYQCSDCSCVFRKLGSLNAHHNRMHPTSNPPPEEVSVQILVPHTFILLLKVICIRLIMEIEMIVSYACSARICIELCLEPKYHMLTST